MTIGGLLYKVMLVDNNPLVEGFQVFLSDQKSVNSFHRKLFNMDGVELKSSVAELGYKLYNLRIYKETFLENNQQFLCKNYSFNAEYHQVIYETIKIKTLFIIFDSVWRPHTLIKC